MEATLVGIRTIRKPVTPPSHIMFHFICSFPFDQNIINLKIKALIQLQLVSGTKNLHEKGYQAPEFMNELLNNLAF